jgi:hypothetical protein
MTFILFPDATETCIGYLTDILPDYGETCPVIKNTPNPRPARFVQVFRTGGPRHNLVVDGAQLTVECWADTDAEAADLAALVRAALLAIRSDVIGTVTFYKVDELAGPADLPDLDSNQARMTWSVIAYVRGHDLQPSGS